MAFFKKLVITAAVATLVVAAVYFGFSPLWDALHSGVGPDVTDIESSVDANANGIDDYSDFVAGAKADAQVHPAYDGGYYQGGYPPDNRGACTDVVWRAFKAAGYSLKDMVDSDIAANPENYPAITAADPNIDFRRVGTLNAFFSVYAQSLSISLDNPEDWQPGDIVVFENDRHIGICSSRRDNSGIPFLLHNSGQPNREEDYLTRPDCMTITGHYRFDASKVDSGVLRYWES